VPGRGPLRIGVEGTGSGPVGFVAGLKLDYS